MARAQGMVQGVGYRFYVAECARETRTTGYVRNEPDGSVLIVAEGENGSLDLFLRMIKADGDPVIRVDTLEKEGGEPTGEFSGFAIRW